MIWFLLCYIKKFIIYKNIRGKGNMYYQALSTQKWQEVIFVRFGEAGREDREHME
jgi:hypothetical protein